MFDSQREWKEFQFNDFFKAARGKRIVKDVDFFEEKNDEYKYPVITAKTSDNGIDGYYFDFNCPENSLIACGEANGMYCTYQKEKCWIMDTARIITFKNGRKFSKELALYMATILKQNMYKFSYGRKAKPSNIDCLNIVLPVDSNGSPDWKYMEDYISNIENRERESKGSIKDSIKTKNPFGNAVDISKFCEYKISDLFTITTGKDFIYNQATGDEYPVIGHGTDNNGLACRTEYLDDYPLQDCSNTISLAHIGNFYATVQPENFYLGTRTKGLKIKFSQADKYALLYICTVINKEKYRFSYGRVGSDKIPDLVISLPSIIKGDNVVPDFYYMSNYIKKLPFADRI